MLLLRASAAALLLFAAGPSQATQVFSGSLVDPEFGTQWSLTIDDQGDADATTYSFVLTADTVNDPNNAGWYTHAILLHLDGGEQPEIFDFTAPGANWNELDASTAPVYIEGFGNETIPMDSWVGFYTDEVSPNLTNPAVDDTELRAGVALDDGGAFTWTADFTLTSGLNPAPSLQAFSYDGINGRSGKIKTSRLSASLVPEPNAAIVFGVGALIVGRSLRRRSH